MTRGWATAAVAVAFVVASPQAKRGEWTSIGQNPASQRYSPLTQINSRNVEQLRVVWTYDLDLKGRTFESTPLVVNGTMYFSTPTDQLIALDASTGKEIWKYDPGEKAVRGNRGVSYWPGDQRLPPRIIFGTSDGRLIEIDAATGMLVDSFGEHGQIDLKETPAETSFRGGFTITSPPVIYRDVAIVAPATQEGPSHGRTGNGDPRAYDIITGKQLWRFHSMPREGEFGSDTWGGPDGWKDRSGPSAWAPISVDEAKGVAFIATGNPADSYYGADRKGTNLYANCILALDASTGKLLWYYQMVHHDLWDSDGVGTTLIDVHRDGATIPAVVGLSKSGLMFILDRSTGKPIFGAEERPVAKSDVPGEESSPTQPFPLKPPPLARDSMAAEELTSITAASAKACMDEWSGTHNSGPYTPFGLTPTINFPAAIGAANWGGASFDPRLGYIFLNTTNLGTRSQMLKTDAGAAMPYRNAGATQRFVGPDGFPCQKPPWGLLTAVNANTGDIVWSVPFGNYDDLGESVAAAPIDLKGLPDAPGKTETIAGCSNCHALTTVTSVRLPKDGWTDVFNIMVSRGMKVSDADRSLIIGYLAANLRPENRAPSSPASETQKVFQAPQNIEATGTPNLGSTAATAAGLVFAGGTLDNMVRAFDAKTGKVLWSAKLDGVAMGGPMTYRAPNGKQIVVVAVGGAGLLRVVHNHAVDAPDEIVAFALP